MASTFTTNLKFNKPALGDAGWGTAINGGFTDLADQAIAGVVDVDVTAGNVTLTSLSGAVDQARAMALRVFGGAVARNVVVPTTSKLYVVQNDCTAAIQVKTSVDPGVLIPAGHSAIVRVDPTVPQVVFAMDYLQSLRLGFALDATYGGTGQSSYAVGDLLYAGTTTTLAKLTVGAANAVLTSSGTVPQWSATLPVASGGTGAATLAANNVLLGNGTSAVQEVAPGTAGNVLRSNGTTWTSSALSSATDTAEGLVELATTAEVQTGTDTTRAITPAGLRGGMIVSPGPGGYVASGAAQIDITSIPSWVRRITVTFEDVSTNGSNKIDIQVGDAGGIETSGYVGSNSNTSTGAAASLYVGHAFEIRYSGGAAQYSGAFTLIKAYTAGDLWIGTGMHATGAIANVIFSAGRKTLSQTLDRLRISAGGNLITGIVNIMYE